MPKKKRKKKFKIRQSSSNLSLPESAKARYQNMINKSKVEEQNNISNFSNEAQDEKQFWHRYNKVLGRKNNNIIEALFDETTNEHIFEGSKISEKLIQHHIEKINKSSYNASFEKNISQVLKNTTADIENVFFVKADIKHAIKSENKHAASGPDRITTELVENGGEIVTKSLTLLIQTSC